MTRSPRSTKYFILLTLLVVFAFARITVAIEKSHTSVNALTKTHASASTHSKIVTDLSEIFNGTVSHPEDFMWDVQSLQMSSAFYYVANDDVGNDICWSEWDVDYEALEEQPCGLMFSITGISFIYHIGKTRPRQLWVVDKMTNDTIATVLSKKTTNLDSIIIHIKGSTLGECHCIHSDIFLLDYLHNQLQIADSKSNFVTSVKLGLEYDTTLLYCCESETFNVLKHVESTVFRLVLNPEKTVFSYGLFLEVLTSTLQQNRKFVHKHKPNSMLLVRLVVHVPDDDFALGNNVVRFRYSSLVSKYLDYWIKETDISHEVFIVGMNLFADSFVLPTNLEFLQKSVSPVYDIQFPTKLTSEMSTYETLQTLQAASTMFKSVLISDFQLQNLLNLSVNNSIILSNITDSLPKLDVFLEYEEKKVTKQYKDISELGKQRLLLNVRTIFFQNDHVYWSDPDWMDTFDLLESKNIQIGCISGNWNEIPENYLAVIDATTNSCTRLLNMSTEVLHTFRLRKNVGEKLPRLLHILNQAHLAFKKIFLEKSLVYRILISHTGTSTMYCNSYTQRLSEFYEAIVTYANLHKWKSLYLRSVVHMPLESGWWRAIDPLNHGFLVFARTNVETRMEEEQLLNTFPCIQHTLKPPTVGINFLQKSGTTINMNLRPLESLINNEIEIMLQVALGRFFSVEVIISTIYELRMIKTLLVDTSFLSKLQNARKAIGSTDFRLYIEVPIKNIISEHDDVLSLSQNQNTALHVTDWENLTKQQELGIISGTIYKNYKLGITVKNCEEEIKYDLGRLKHLNRYLNYSYIVCQTSPVFANNINLTGMEKYLESMFYVKAYLQKFLKVTEVMFRLNLITTDIGSCTNSSYATDNLLQFLNDVNQHGIAYNIQYFVVPAFEIEIVSSNKCSTSWWHILDYKNLTNISVYVDREDEHYNRSTRPRLQFSSEGSLPVKSTRLTVIITTTTLISLLLLSLLLVMWLYTRKLRKRYLTEQELNNFYNGENVDMEWLNDSSLTWMKQEFPKHFEIPKHSIQLGKVIGKGEFGIVHHSILDSKLEVAVKRPRKIYEKEKLKSLLAEIKIFCHIGRHENVITFLGAYTKEISRGNVYIVTEFCHNGSLQSYLLKIEESRKCNPNFCIDLYELYKFAFEIASGMKYISEQDVVHGDLSARNVLLTVEYTCKISDFGLSRRLYGLGEYIKKSEGPTPWKWMAPESLKINEFTVMSDIWSFGVTVWEIFSLGTFPYPGMSWSSEFVKMLEDGMRMGKPLYAPANIHDKLLACWNVVPAERPTFLELMEYFTHLRCNEYN